MEVFLTCGWCETALLSGLEKDCRHFGFTRDVNISWMKFLHFTLRSAPPAPLWWARIVGLWSEPLRDQTVIFDRRKRLETCSVCSFVYLNSHPAERMFWWVIKGRVAVMMTAAHLYTLSLSLSLSLSVCLSLSINPLYIPGPSRGPALLGTRCWYHPWGFLTTNLPARFNKESADDAILTVNLLDDMQTLVGKDSSSTPLMTAVARTRWEAAIFIQLRISEKKFGGSFSPATAAGCSGDVLLTCWNPADQAWTFALQLQF